MRACTVCVCVCVRVRLCVYLCVLTMYDLLKKRCISFCQMSNVTLTLMLVGCHCYMFTARRWMTAPLMWMSVWWSVWWACMNSLPLAGFCLWCCVRSRWQDKRKTCPPMGGEGKQCLRATASCLRHPHINSHCQTPNGGGSNLTRASNTRLQKITKHIKERRKKKRTKNKKQYAVSSNDSLRHAYTEDPGRGRSER